MNLITTKETFINDIPKIAAFLIEGEYSIEVKPYKKPRSLSANAYFWVLVNQIANVLRASKDEVHFEMLKRYSQHSLISVLATVDISGYIKYYDEAGRAKIGDKEFVHYRVFKGSSDMNTEEMSILLDGVVSDAKELGIETEADAMLRSMLID